MERAYVPTKEHRAIAALVAKGQFISASAKALAAKVAEYDRRLKEVSQ